MKRIPVFRKTGPAIREYAAGEDAFFDFGLSSATGAFPCRWGIVRFGAPPAGDYERAGTIGGVEAGPGFGECRRGLWEDGISLRYFTGLDNEQVSGKR